MCPSRGAPTAADAPGHPRGCDRCAPRRGLPAAARPAREQRCRRGPPGSLAARLPRCHAGSMRAAETAAREGNAAAAHGGGRRRRPPLRPDRFPVGWSVGRPWSEPSESHGSVGSVGRLSRSLEPLRRPWLAAQRPILAIAQRVVGLDERVQLGRPLVDDGGLRIAQIALDGKLVRVAVGAVDLNGVESTAPRRGPWRAISRATSRACSGGRGS